MAETTRQRQMTDYLQVCQKNLHTVSGVPSCNRRPGNKAIHVYLLEYSIKMHIENLLRRIYSTQP